MYRRERVISVTGSQEPDKVQKAGVNIPAENPTEDLLLFSVVGQKQMANQDFIYILSSFVKKF